MKLKLTVGLVIIAIIQACGQIFQPENSCNFVQNSKLQRVSWKDQTPITIFIDESVPEDYYDAILSAIERWERARGRQLFKYGGVVSGGDSPAKDQQSIIYWSDSWGDGTRCSSRPSSPGACEQARTTVYWMGNQINEADMIINDYGFDFSTSEEGESGMVDFESLVVHELGHVLGLSHNEEDAGSVMAKTLANARIRRDPTKEDLDSLSCEY